MDGRRSATAAAPSSGSSVGGSPIGSNSSGEAVGIVTRRRSRQRRDGSGNNGGEAIQQHEIDHWIAAGKKSTQLNKHQEEDAQNLLIVNSMNKLRDLQKEIEATNWIFDT
jgi:hypothetical protein